MADIMLSLFEISAAFLALFIGLFAVSESITAAAKIIITTIVIIKVISEIPLFISTPQKIY